MKMNNKAFLIFLLGWVLFFCSIDVLAKNYSLTDLSSKKVHEHSKGPIKVLYEKDVIAVKGSPIRKRYYEEDAVTPPPVKLIHVKSSLNRTIVETLKNHPDIVAHLKSLMASEQATYAAEGGYLPRLDLRGTFGGEKRSNANTNFDYDHFYPKVGKLTLTQNLFSGFYTSSEVSRNRYKTLAQKYLLEGAANDVALLTVKAYLDILRTSKIVGMAKDNYSSHLRTYRMIKERSETGVGRDADRTQAYGRLSLAKASVLAAENNYKNSLSTFKRVTGLCRSDCQLKFPEDPTMMQIPSNISIATKEALRNHPLLKSANSDIKEARSQYDSSKNRNYPHLDLIGDATHGHDINGLKDRNNQFGVYLQLNYNLFSGGSDISMQREKAELIGKAQAIRDKTHRQVVENMELAWNSYETINEQLKYFQRHENAARSTVSSYREQFKLGRRTLLDLLDSEDELFNARIDNINGKIRLMLAKFRILSAEGKLLSYFGVDFFQAIK